MLESLVTWVLNNYVGDYLENLNTDQLSIALLSGQVELENVPLKTTALRKLDLPLTVRSGVLGKLTLSVPVTRVRSEPWTLRLSDVLILLGPENRSKYDAEVEETADKARKQAQLDELERLHHSELASAMGLPVRTDEDASWWGASLLSTVLNNIQLIVSNVHIRYEDETSIEGKCFAAGIRIQNVLVQTTNHRWKPGFVEPQEGANVFKKLELRDFSFYWNSGAECSTGIETPKDVQRLLSPETVGANAYVIAPCCLELRMEKNASKLPLKEKMPRFKFLLRPELIAIELSSVQMREMRAITREWARFERARPHRKWRPAVPVGGNAAAWWHFAKARVVAEGRLEMHRRTWKAAETRVRALNVYARAYKRRLLALVHNAVPPTSSSDPSAEAAAASSAAAALKHSEEDRTIMRQIERDPQYSFNELSIIRDVVFARLVREYRVDSGTPEGEAAEQFESISPDEVPPVDGVPREEPPQQGGGWMTWMTSFFSTGVVEEREDDKRYEFGPIDLSELRRDLPTELREMEKQVDKEILEVLHDSWDDSTLLRKDFLLADVCMRIDHITLRLTDSASASSSRGGRVLALDLLGVSSQLELSPRTHSLAVSLSVDDLSVQRLQIVPSTPTSDVEDFSLMYSLTEATRILFAMGREGGKEEEKASDGSPMFRLLYRRRSIKAVRHTIEASFRPLSGMYDQDALSGLAALFADAPHDEEDLDGLEAERVDVQRKSTAIKMSSHVFASIRFPSIKMELRKAGDGLLPPAHGREGEEGRAIATLTVDAMEFVVETKEEELTEARLSIGRINLADNLEGTAYPLLTNQVEGTLEQIPTSLSSSWPQLHTSSSAGDIIDKSDTSQPLSSSLPRDGPLPPKVHLRLPMSDDHVSVSRKASAAAPSTSATSTSTDRGEIVVRCSLVGDGHPLFESKYDKKNVVVEVDVSRVEVGMNRRTWMALMDMAGLCGGDPEHEEEKGRAKQKAESRIAATLRMHSLAVHMEYPSGEYRLGSLLFDEMEVLTKLREGEDRREALRVDASFGGLRILDRSPVFSALYDTRLILQGENPGDRTRVRLIKYAPGHRDECDMKVGLETGEGSRLLYAHTHRFLCAFMDFWCQFAELQDLVTKSKATKIEETARARVLVDMKLPGRADILLPRSYEGDRALLLTANGLSIKNYLERASELATIIDELALEREGVEGVDCLLDRMAICLKQVRLREALRMDATEKNRSLPDLLDFSSFLVRGDATEAFSVPLDIEVTSLRNLSNEQSHAIPDQSFLITMRCFRWDMTSRFFCLLRGFLELNLGEPLIPAPETIPVEILNKPIMSCEVGSDKKYATLSVRLLLEEVVADVSIGVGAIDAALHAPLATIHYVQARLSFDVYVDGQAEIDLICEKARILDRRDSRSLREEYGPVLAPLDEDNCKLMGEAHLMLRKDESPILTVVLMNARIVVLPDFLNDIKDFILISPHQMPPAPPDSARSLGAGVIGRAAALVVPPPGPPNSIKVTIRNSELIVPESPFVPDSLALIAKTNTVIQMTEHGGNVNATLEIQDMSLAWCPLSSSSRAPRAVFSNEFSATLGVVMARDLSHNKGLPILVPPRLMIQAQLEGLICKLSHHDVGALRDISTGYGTFATTQQRSLFTKPIDPGLALGVVSLKCEQAHVWLQDELNGASLPLFRVSTYELSLERDTDKLRGSFRVSADYFNQSLFGWEPLLEDWHVIHLNSNRKDTNTSVELRAGSKSTLDITVSEQLISQLLSLQQRLPAVQESLRQKVYRGGGVGGAVHHMAYVLKNSTEGLLTFTTSVDEVLTARTEQRKSAVRWQSVAPGSSLYFEFPTKLLFYSATEREPPRQLIVRVKGWDESSPVNVDASGSYFRVVKALESSLQNARIVIRVSMERDGRKQIEVCSSVRVYNQLPHPVSLYEENTDRVLARVESGSRAFVPLKDAHLAYDVFPEIGGKRPPLRARARLTCAQVRNPGEVVDTPVCLAQGKAGGESPYWLCTSIRRERYPEADSLPGHAIRLLPPLTVQSLLPVDAQFKLGGKAYELPAGKSLKISTVDTNHPFAFGVETDRLCEMYPFTITPTDLSMGEDKRTSVRLVDENHRALTLFVNARKTRGGAVSISLWTPFWILNKSALPLVVRQDAAPEDAPGQGEEHERASDRHALMFDLAEEKYPAKCCIRLGTLSTREKGYLPMFCRGVDLSPGVQALRLQLVHESLPTLYYNIGVEVRPGTGLYKDTQVVLLTSRYILNNASSLTMHACHYDQLDQPSRHVSIASQCTLVWHEGQSAKSMLCLKRSDAAHWSCPLRIDTVHSCHVTMRAADESPLFFRVEVTLHGAVFHVTLTDAHFYPPPIQIDNRTEVPVLYQQLSGVPQRSHLRTICKAKSKVDYAWDDAADAHQLVLQVFDAKSVVVDPSCRGPACSLSYDNAFFIALDHSFDSSSRGVRGSERSELVLETLQKGKVVLNKQNRVDGNSGAQLWRWTGTEGGCLENVALTLRNKGRYVLDAIDGGRLMAVPREASRNATQRWRIRSDGRVVSEGGTKAITARTAALEVALTDIDGASNDQIFSVARLRPGSGTLDVTCTHSGPTMVVRITDREEVSDPSRPSLSSLSTPPPPSLEFTLKMASGIGLSVVSGAQEELLYARLSGVDVYARKSGDAVQCTTSIEHIQIDNQLLSADRTLVLACRAEQLIEEGSLGSMSPLAIRPALKLEMNCTPRKHFDSFDVFRIRLCPLSLHLDEMLLWKMLHLVNSSRSTKDAHFLTSPPDTNLTRPDALNARRCYFGTLDLQFGTANLSVVTISRSSLPSDLRELKEQYNMKLISFENAKVELPAFRQLHYFETSSFLVENLGKFYLTELRKQTLNIIVSLDAFGNPQGLASDLKDSFQGLFIEGDVSRFISGLGYGFSNSVSKIASSMSSGVGAFTFDQEHEERRMRRSNTNDSALAHLYGGVKGLGVGVLGGVTAMVSSTITEGRKGGVKGAFMGMATGVVDTFTKPVQGLCDLVEGTASAIKHVSSTAGRRVMEEETRQRPPRVCRGLFGLMPPYSESMGRAQLELMRINNHQRTEKLLDVQVFMENINDRLVRHYVLLSSAQAYVCKLEDEQSSVSQRLPYADIRSVRVRPADTSKSLLVPIEVVVEADGGGKERRSLLWCSRAEIATRLVEKIQRAKYDYDHVKRSIECDVDGEDGDAEEAITYG